jgi:nucleotide-binding universal stress UspA family protein
MPPRPILCPVDFSEASRGALRFAATIAEHFYTGLTVVTVEDLLLSEAAATAYGKGWYERQTEQDLERFVKDTFRRRLPIVAELHLEVAIGNPATEILRVVDERQPDLIVMSTHGRTGVSKLFLGSTTERLLRETRVPVLVTPVGDPGPMELEDLRAGFGGVLVPVDLTPFSRHQARVARGLAQALRTPLTIVHVLEGISAPLEQQALVRFAHDERRRRALADIEDLVASLDGDAKPEVVVLEGDAAVTIAKFAALRGIGAIVMGLHATKGFGPRMGSVTYRVLCQTEVPVLALPPTVTDVARGSAGMTQSHHVVAAG